MERLDRENSNHPDSCEYTVIGGESHKLARCPSSLMGSSPNPSALLPEKCPRCQMRKKRHAVGSGEEEPPGSRPSSSSSNGAILRWDEEDVMAWLKETGWEMYEETFKKHAIRSGQSLVALEEEHLKEMGVWSVGHRLELARAIEDVRKDAGLVSREKYTDINMLMAEMNAIQLQNTLAVYPQRIILIRHGQSEGNVDTSLYAVKPDRKMELTPLGVKQACVAGAELKQLIHEESVCFYVSTFARSRQTFEQVRQAFHDEQVLHVREDPRIREQEWGNFQDPSTMMEAMKERRKVGSFYYRFLTGESGADVYDRVSTFLETLYRDMEKGGCGENAIIVSHGLFCRLFLMRYYHWKVERFHKLWNFENCQYAIMEKQPEGNYRLVSELKTDP